MFKRREQAIHDLILRNLRGRSEHRHNLYGWVLESKLQRIDDLTFQEIDKVEAAKAVKKDAAKMEEKYSPLMAKVHPIYRKACTWSGWAALGLIAIFLVPAFYRFKFWNLLWFIPIFVVLKIAGDECIMPTWLMLVVIPFMAYVICFPFLYFRTALAYRWIYWGVSLCAAGFYAFLYLKIMSSGVMSMVFRSLLLVLILFGVYLVVGLISRWIGKDICPNCGYFAKHSQWGRRTTGTTVSHGTGRQRVHDGQTVEVRDNIRYVTNHYHDENYQTETTTTHYETDRCCLNCGEPFVNYSSSSFTRRI